MRAALVVSRLHRWRLCSSPRSRRTASHLASGVGPPSAAHAAQTFPVGVGTGLDPGTEPRRGRAVSPDHTGRDELDERTASDLDLDAVFEKLDRTETRVTAAKTERHRIQFSLTRLRGHSGDLWWLAQPGVIEPKPWDVVFPLLPPVVPLALALATVWPHRPPAW